MRTDFAILREEEDMLIHLDACADRAKLDGTYFVETGRALSIPASFEADERIIIKDFYDLAFQAPFVAYTVVRVGRIIGAHSVRALCVTFDKAKLLPYFETIPEDHLLHVPVLAVDTIERTD